MLSSLFEVMEIASTRVNRTGRCPRRCKRCGTVKSIYKEDDTVVHILNVEGGASPVTLYEGEFICSYCHKGL